MYTETGTLVDDIAKHYDNTDLDTVQDVTRRQNKIMQFVNRARDEIWWSRPFPWTWKATPLTMSSGYADAPNDFSQVGQQGGLYEDANGRPWVEINFQEMQTLRNRSVRVNDKLFAIGPRFDFSRLAVIVPNTASTAQFTFVYRARPLNLTYGENIDPMPAHFGQALLLGAVARIKEEEGDPRPLWREDYQAALSRAYAIERESPSRVTQMPVAVGRKW